MASLTDSENETKAEPQRKLSEQDTETQHPLLHHVVLTEVFSYLSPSDLKKCRLVTPVWNQESSALLKTVADFITISKIKFKRRRERQTRIISNPDLPPQLQPAIFEYRTVPGEFNKRREIVQMSRLTQCINKSDNFPFTKFLIETTFTGKPSYDRALEKFLTCISSWVTHLTITDVTAKYLVVGGHPSKPICYSALKTLSFQFDSSNPNDTVDSHYTFIESILENSPALEEIDVLSNNNDTLHRIVRSLRKTGSPKITRFSIEGPMDSALVNKMIPLKFQLTYLYLGFRTSNIQAAPIQDFLECQSETLQELKIWTDGHDRNNLLVEFPRMPKLKKLIIFQIHYRPMKMKFLTVSYAKQFPALKSLSFTRKWRADDCFKDFLKRNIKPCETLTELKLPEKFEDEEHLPWIGNLFPNLKKLEISAACKNIVSVAIDSWPKLEELILIVSKYDSIDVIMTGLSCMRYKHLDFLVNPIYRDLAERSKKKCKDKTISCLKDLKILRFRPWAADYDVRFSTEMNEASYEQIMNMKSLKLLDVQRNNAHGYIRISREWLAEMKKKFVVLQN